MTDTGEQGTLGPDPADSTGIGGGLVPGDEADGELQEAEIAYERDTWGDAGASAAQPGPAAPGS